MKKKQLKNDLARHGKPVEDMRQFQIKIDKWKQLLDSETEENVFLKNSISDILKNNFDQKRLEEIEEFQTHFIKMDELIHSLKGRINNSADFPHFQIFEDVKAERQFFRSMKGLGRDINTFASQFHLLKSAFNDFQLKIFERREN